MKLRIAFPASALVQVVVGFSTAPLQTFYSFRQVSQLQSTSSTTDYLEKVREDLAEAGFEERWQNSVTVLSEAVSIDPIQAEDCLAQIWNWKSWARTKSKIARRYIKTIEPSESHVKDCIEWLREGPLALDDETLRAGILEVPTAYLTNPQENYEKALKTAPPAFKDPNAFRELLLKDPSSLKCTYNCVNDGCASECGNCWVSFQLASKHV